jgi:hypothetical protein
MLPERRHVLAEPVRVAQHEVEVAGRMRRTGGPAATGPDFRVRGMLLQKKALDDVQISLGCALTPFSVTVRTI